MRPWKREQLGGGYALSSFAEQTALEAADAIVAVSAAHLARDPRLLPGDRPRADERDLQRDRRRRVPARSRHGRARAARHRPVAAVRRLRRPDHAAEGARRTCSTRRPRSTRRRSSSSARARRTRPRSRPRSPRSWRSCAPTRGNVVWIEEMLPKPDADPDPQPRDRLRLPVGLRADGDRQPRGDGVRGRGRRDRRRRHPRGGRGRRHRPARRRTRREPTGPARRSTRPGWRPASPRASTSCSPTRRAPRAMGGAGRARAVERFGWDVAAAETLAALRAPARLTQLGPAGHVGSRA